MLSAHDLVTVQPRLPVKQLLCSVPDLLAFEAPYLMQKLIKLGVVANEIRGAELLQEVKKYLALSLMHHRCEIPIYSTRVDEAWHQFVLFTVEYADFCKRLLGGFVHHVPFEAEHYHRGGEPKPSLSFMEFKAVYEASFGEFSPLWFDQDFVTIDSHVGRSIWAKRLGTELAHDRALLVLDDTERTVVCRASTRAAAALQFIASTQVFHVRELPGLRSAAERIQLCATLIEGNVLALAL